MIALGLRVWMAYGTVVVTTAMLCANLAITADARSATAQAATTAARSWPSENPPRPLPAKPVKFPPYEIRKLANGLQVVLVSHHEQPAVSAIHLRVARAS